ncbi:MAG: glycosyltransferase family 4 protein [Phycisphaerae bacterium]|nr:glycosyltransferase family 4 protein [Phycisphaerae bacterium]
MQILHIDKFLHASDAAGGGVGRYVRTLSDELSRRGHVVDEFGCAETAARTDRPAFEDFTDAAGLGRFIKLLHNPSAAALLKKHLRKNPADVAHLHNVYHHLTASILPVLAGCGVGVVMTLHDYRQIGFEKIFWRWGMGDPDSEREDEFYHEARRRCTGLGGWALRLRGFFERSARWYSRWVDVFLCPTEFMCEQLRQAGTPRDKIVYSPVPLPIGEVPPAADDGKTVLFAGRLSVEKSPGLMLDLAGRLGDAHIVLAGDGPLRQSLAERCRREGLSNVEMLGHISRGELMQWYARAAAVVIASRCMENSPVAMLEAMSAGRCVIAPDQPPLREWVSEGRTGRLYATGNAEQLASVVRETLGSETTRRDMGAAARRCVQPRHDLAAAVDTIEKAYEEARRRCALR